MFSIGTAAIACSYCLNGCTVNDPGITAPSNIDFTLDLSNAAYSGLKQIGGYVYINGVIVAHTASGYVALSQACTHQGTTIVYYLAGNSMYCPAHGSRFGLDGSVMKGPAQDPLVRYNTSLNGNSLRVYP